MIYINPPPADAKCEGCRRHVEDLPFFENPHFKEAKLVKDFRGGECVSAYWSCQDCVKLTDEDFFAQWK